MVGKLVDAMNPFNKFKAAAGAKTVGDLSFAEMNSTKEFRNAYNQWVLDRGAYAFDTDEQIEKLLELCVIYKLAKDTNSRTRTKEDQLSKRLQDGKIKEVVASAQKQAVKLMEILPNTEKGLVLANMLQDMVDNPDEYIHGKMAKLPSNRKDIDDLLNSLHFDKAAKTALYKLL